MQGVVRLGGITEQSEYMLTTCSLLRGLALCYSFSGRNDGCEMMTIKCVESVFDKSKKGEEKGGWKEAIKPLTVISCTTLVYNVHQRG